MSILSTWPGFFQTLVWCLFGLSAGESFMFLSGLGMNAALSTELSRWSLQNPPQGSAPGKDMGGGGLRGLLSPWCVFLPLADALLETRLTDETALPHTTSFRSPRYYSEQSPTLLFLCSRAILPEERIPFFFLVLQGSIRIFFSKDKEDHTCWLAARTQGKGWLEIHDTFNKT